MVLTRSVIVESHMNFTVFRYDEEMEYSTLEPQGRRSAQIIKQQKVQEFYCM